MPLIFACVLSLISWIGFRKLNSVRKMLKYYDDYSMKDCNVPCSTVLILALVVDNKTFFFWARKLFLRVPSLKNSTILLSKIMVPVFVRFSYRNLMKIYTRAYYTATRRYGFYFRVVKIIRHSFPESHSVPDVVSSQFYQWCIFQ